MTLKEIIDAAKAGVTVISEQGPMGQEITSVTLDSRKACAGALFVAQRGEKVDGHAFIEYVAPFDRCNREADYETAWNYFTQKYGTKN